MNPSDGDLAPANPSTPPTSPTERRFGTENQEPESSATCTGEGEIESEGSDHGNTGESVPLQLPNFVWGDLSGRHFCDKVNKAYSEVVEWRGNLFLVPFGKVGKTLIQEMANLFQVYCAESMPLMQVLLLQKPSKTSKAKDHVTCLQRCLESWKKGEIEVLVVEGQCIQSHHPSTDTRMNPEAVSWAFSKMMFLVNVHGALNFLSRNTSGLPLKLEDVIQTKEDTTESVLNTGPSGVDACTWRRICSSFKETSSLCEAIAGVAKRICTQPVSPSGLNALLACRLVPLNKNPGVRPIGVGEVAQRIVCKAVIRVVRKDIMLAAGPLQACSGIGRGCEVAVHATREVFDEFEVERALLVDATDAFNAFNRKVALQNMKYVCPVDKLLPITYTIACVW